MTVRMSTAGLTEMEDLGVGNYVFDILKQPEVKYTENKKPYLNIGGVVAEGENAGRWAWGKVFLTPAAAWVAKRFMDKLDIPYREEGENELEFEEVDYVNVRFTAPIIVDDFGAKIEFAKAEAV